MKKIKKFFATMLITNLRRMMWSLIGVVLSAPMIYEGGVIGEMVRNPSTHMKVDKWELVFLFFCFCFVASLVYWVVDGIIKMKK